MPNRVSSSAVKAVLLSVAASMAAGSCDGIEEAPSDETPSGVDNHDRLADAGRR